MTGVDQDRLSQLGQDRLAERIPRRDQLRDEIAPTRKAQVVRAQLALEYGPVLNFAPWQAPTATTQRVNAAAHELIRLGKL